MSEWATITSFVQPSALDEVMIRCLAKDTRFVCNGSRLLATRPNGVHQLVSISGLMNHEVTVTGDTIRVGAGCTLQQFIDTLTNGPGQTLAEAAVASCVSRNLRNQCSIGGELAAGRVDSDLRVALTALNPDLDIFDGTSHTDTCQEWNGTGIILNATFPIDRATSLRTERFSLLPTGPAFAVVAAAKINGKTSVAVGGAAERITHILLDSPATDSVVTDLAAAMRDDHYGSLDYKRHLVRTALERVGAAS